MNARSIQNKTEEIQSILYNINTSLSSSIQLIAISEHWIKQNETQHYLFEQYNTIISVREDKKGGGSSVFILNNLNYEVIKQYSDNEFSITSVKIVLSPQNKIVLSCVYRPPDSNVDKTYQFLQLLQNHLQQIQNERAYIVGDFNFDLIVNNNA